jgi:hypothetical protein
VFKFFLIEFFAHGLFLFHGGFGFFSRAGEDLSLSRGICPDGFTVANNYPTNGFFFVGFDDFQAKGSRAFFLVTSPNLDRRGSLFFREFRGFVSGCLWLMVA